MRKKEFRFGLTGILIMLWLQWGLSQYEIGLKIGTFVGNSSSDIVGDIVPLEWEAGPELGFYAERGIGKGFSVTSGLEYSKKGFSIDQGTNIDLMGIILPIGARADFNLHYLESPLALKYSLGEGDTKFYGLVGASLGYAIGGNIETKANFIFEMNIGNIDIPFSDNNVSRWNPSALVGAGAEHQLANGKIFGDIRYKHGLNSIISDTFLDVNLLNKGFSIGIGYAMIL